MSSVPPPADSCPSSNSIRSYAACTLNEQQSALIEEHLSGCGSCRTTLAQAVDQGATPVWLSDLMINPVRTKRDSGSSLSHAQNATLLNSTTSTERYQRIRLQGEGGMGQVWQGWDVVMKRRVALKQLRSDRRNADRDRRLFQEATTLARLSHPNIVAVHEVLMLNEQPTLVMEFVDGPALSEVTRDFVLSERQAATILERLADAMAHAHQQGVIHRDLKPGNVLLSWPEKPYEKTHAIDHATPRLTDFGLAKILEGDDLTRTGDLLGTPAYMAPEQTIGVGNVAGPSADIYGLGAILYDLLTGTAPHVAENPVTTLLLVREREPTAPRLLRPRLSKDIETICLKCLQKQPNDRYASATELRNDLLAYLDGRPISARPIGPVRTAFRWSRRHKSVVASGILAASLFLTLLFGSLWTASNERRLRLEANDARIQAEASEKKFIAEAERAKNALDINRQHFEVALDGVNRLAELSYNPLSRPLTELDFGRGIRQATKDIYMTYLETLPSPDQWTLQEAYYVTFFIKYMVALGHREIAVPWLERVKSIAPRLEQQGSDSPRMREFLAQHYRNASIHAYAVNDFIGSGRYGEQAGQFIDVDPRLAAHVLMSSAISYGMADSHEDAIRAANASVQAYRTAMKQPNPWPDDSASFLEILRWHRHIANQAGNKEEVDKFVSEFEERASHFDKSSPYYDRVQASHDAFHNSAIEP